MGLPKIIITFHALARSAIARSERGTVALILREENKLEKQIYRITDLSEIPEKLSEENVNQIKLAMKGSNKSAKEVIVFLTDKEGELGPILKSMLTTKFDYLAIPSIKPGETDEVVTFVKKARDINNVKIKAVLPNVNANYEGIINFTTDDIETKDKTYKTNEYCSRMAGIFATMPLNMSATYFKLPEVISIKPVEDEDEKVDNGELILINDGRKIKIGRAINSLTEIREGISHEWKKIKIVDTMDLIYNDIRNTFEDNYIGKVANNLDNKMIFVTSVNNYFMDLEEENILNEGQNKSWIDTLAHKTYLKKEGKDLEDINAMDEQELLHAKTGSILFLAGKVSILDAMEDLTFNVEVI